MKYIDLFAGIGGFRLGIEKAGESLQRTERRGVRLSRDKSNIEGGDNEQPETWRDRKLKQSENFECVYTNEYDKYAAQIYEKNFGGTVDTRDITTIPTSDIPDHDFLVGGFPCQAFSIAGKRGGFDDTRGTLFFDIARILKAKQPRLLLLENVKGLLSHDNGRTFKTIISTLDELGYDLQWQVLNSKNFGVPQNRERVFIIGHLRGEPRPQVFPIRESDSPSIPEEGYSSGKGQRIRGSDISAAIDANYHKGQGSTRQMIQSYMIHNVYGGFGEKKVREFHDYSPTIRTPKGGGHLPMVAMKWQRTEKGRQARRESQKQGRDYTPFSDGHRELAPSDRGAVGALTSQAIAKDSLIGNEMQIRRLTPVECERLQGFPDGFTEGVSDTQRYKTLGNAVTVNVIEWIIGRMFK